jgi:hypothetical protein
MPRSRDRLIEPERRQSQICHACPPTSGLVDVLTADKIDRSKSRNERLATATVRDRSLVTFLACTVLQFRSLVRNEFLL